MSIETLKSNHLFMDSKSHDLTASNEVSVLDAKIKFIESANCYLFDPSLFLKLKPSEFKFQYDKFEIIKNDRSKENLIDLGDDLLLRPLRRGDFSRGYMNLMSQLTEIGDVTKEVFEKRFDEMKSAQNTYYICVVEDLNKKTIIASLTLVFEQKFIRNASSRGRIEDMVVDVDYRGKKLSKLLLDVHCQMSSILGCYKISLECKDHLKKHYEQFEFSLEAGQNYMCRRYI